MDAQRIRRLLQEVQAGRLSVEAALDRLRQLPFEDLGFARLDHHRPLRKGRPEVVYCPGKTPQQVAAILARLAQENPRVLATRADEGVFRAVREVLPQAEFDPEARCVFYRHPELAGERPRTGIVLLTGGTADQWVAQEARVTAELWGHAVELHPDVGVAALPRLLAVRTALERARVVVVVAGMDAALPSVVGGLVSAPLIAVPTSVGYGASFAGLAALLAMLNACPPGVAVVNIDNGFGAGYLAARINELAWEEQRAGEAG